MPNPTLILIPGLLSSKTVWYHQCKHLSDSADIKVIELTQEDSAEQMVSTILKQAPEKFALAGHSMGGWLALEVMKNAPEKVTQLCLLNTTARDDSPEKLNNRKKMIKAAKDGQFTEIAQQIATRFVLNQQVKEEVLQMFLQVGSQAFINQQNAMISRQECLSVLPKIHCPTLIIHASQDENFSLEEHEELANRIPAAKLAIIKDSGHMSPMEMPQAVTTLMRFWLKYFPKDFSI